MLNAPGDGGVGLLDYNKAVDWRSGNRARERVILGLNTHCITSRLCPSSVCTSWPVAMFHSFTVLSSEALTSIAPSGENAHDFTSSPCPSSVCTGWPVAVFHSFTVLS